MNLLKIYVYGLFITLILQIFINLFKNCLKTTKNHIFLKFLILIFFSPLYKDGAIETTKCSKNKLKQNFRGSEYSFRIRKYNIIFNNLLG